MVRMARALTGAIHHRKASGYSALSGDVDGDAGKAQAASGSHDKQARERAPGGWLRRFREMLLGSLRALTPRVWAATPLDLALARILITLVVLDALPWSVDHAQEQFSYNVDPDGRNMRFTYPVCGGLVKSFTWGRWDISTYATGEFAWLRRALWLSLLGLATPVSMAVAGWLVIRYKVITLGLQLSTGHWNDFMGPVILMLAFSPCGDVLSLDCALRWLMKRGRGGACALRQMARSPRQAACAALLALDKETKRQPTVRYGLSLMVVALYIGVYILAAGLAKASSGPHRLLNWAFSDYVRGQMHLFWIRQGGQAYIPSLASVRWNPLRLITNSYLFPILRVDKIPILLHVGNEIVMIWECLHWYLLLCAPAVRYFSVLCDIAFHINVALMMGIYWFYHLLAAHLIFLPWSYLLSKPCSALVEVLNVSGASEDDHRPHLPSGALKVHGKQGETGSSEGQAGRFAKLVRLLSLLLAVAVGVFFVGGQAFELIPRNHGKFLWIERSGVAGHCHPFDPAPGFKAPEGRGRLVFWQHASKGTFRAKFEDVMRTTAKQIHFVHSDGEVSSMHVWEAICRMERKKHCIVYKRNNSTSYNNVCCLMAAPFDLHGKFRNQLVVRFTQQETKGPIVRKEFIDLWKMLSTHTSVVPHNNSTRSIVSVVFSRPNKILVDPDAGWDAVISGPQTKPFDEKCEILIPVGAEGRRTDVLRKGLLSDRFTAMLQKCEYEAPKFVPIPSPDPWSEPFIKLNININTRPTASPSARRHFEEMRAVWPDVRSQKDIHTSGET